MWLSVFSHFNLVQILRGMVDSHFRPPDHALEHLEEEGFVVIPSALPQGSCGSTRDGFLDRLAAAVSSGSTDAFSKIQTPEVEAAELCRLVL